MVCRLVMFKFITVCKRNCGKAMFLIVSTEGEHPEWCVLCGGAYVVAAGCGYDTMRYGQSAGGRHPTGMHNFYCYCVQTKLKECNFFMSVCHYVHRGIMHPEEGRFHMGCNPPPPHTHTQTVNGRACNRHRTGMHTCSKDN